MAAATSSQHRFMDPCFGDKIPWTDTSKAGSRNRMRRLTSESSIREVAL